MGLFKLMHQLKHFFCCQVECTYFIIDAGIPTRLLHTLILNIDRCFPAYAWKCTLAHVTHTPKGEPNTGTGILFTLHSSHL